MNDLSEPQLAVNQKDAVRAVMPDDKGPYVAKGMPPLTYGDKPVSFFEFWPTWLVYLPVVVQWLFLSARYRSLTLPLIANPSLPLSGMVGVPKSNILSQATGRSDEAILDWVVYNKTNEAVEAQAIAIKQMAKDAGIHLPFVCKPDIGCRGAGVKLIKSDDQLVNCLQTYPVGGPVMVQKLSNYEPEAGLFFVRQPDEGDGEIISLALKYSPYVVGNGSATLCELIERDPRASEVSHLYFERHAGQLDLVLEQGEVFKLVFSASHCRGAVFRDARDMVTPELVAGINHILRGLPEFYYGRLDIKFKDVEHLQAGETIEIIEINTASSEPLHIWDGRMGFFDAIGALLFQYRLLFKIGAKNRARGKKTPSLMTLLKNWRLERELTKSYPTTD